MGFKSITNTKTSDVYLIAVPTPFKGDYEPDVSYVFQQFKILFQHLKKGALVILESTSPVGQLVNWRTTMKRAKGGEFHCIIVPDCRVLLHRT